MRTLELKPAHKPVASYYVNRPRNRGRDQLYADMRHWTCRWLKRERFALYKELPWSYAQGRRSPVTAPACRRIILTRKKLVTEECLMPNMTEETHDR